MARERMVTRTIENASVEVMSVNVKEQTIENVTLEISATIGEENALKYIQKHFDSAERKHVSIVKYTVSETLYGMTEQEFIKLAKVLPPRGTKSED